MEDLMRGQRLGRYQGNTQGVVTVELDDLGDHYEGMAYVYPGTQGLPSIAGGGVTEKKKDRFAAVSPKSDWAVLVRRLRAHLEPSVFCATRQVNRYPPISFPSPVGPHPVWV